MLILDAGVERALEAHARSGYPHEVCGLLVGRIEGSGARRVLEAKQAANLNRERAGDRYDLDPADYLRIEREARTCGLEVVGVYHSHPDHPSRPSEIDRRRAEEIWQDAASWSYLIVEVAAGEPASRRSWILRGGVFEEEEIRVVMREDAGTNQVEERERTMAPAIGGGSDKAARVSTAGTTIQDLLKDLRGRVREETPSQVKERLASSDPPVLIDVREKDEVDQGHLPGAIHLPRGFLELRIEGLMPDRSRPIVAYCARGNRSLLAAEGLQRLGYDQVVSMSGGFTRWRSEGLPVATPQVLTEADRRRYSRHLMIPEVGEAGQMKLLQARVLLIGAGGLGSPAGYYLAAAGVGTVGIVDFDVVDESNLQRQILHAADRVGIPKTESARRTLSGLNPGIRVVPIEVRLSSANVESIFKDYDIVVDGSDNFPTRYLVNDACVLMKKPNVHGSVYRFEGQVTVFDPPHGPCYRCLYPEPPPAELAPSCAEAGVLGVLPGVVGLLEAVETVKLILGAGETLVGRLLHYDALKAEFRMLRLRRDPACRYCGDGAVFPGFIDYEQFCADASAPHA